MKIDIDTIALAYGSHKNAAAGLCLMEAVAYVAGEKHSDHPAEFDHAYDVDFPI